MNIPTFTFYMIIYNVYKEMESLKDSIMVEYNNIFFNNHFQRFGSLVHFI